VIERLLRELAPAVVGAVARRYRDFAGAEDAVQEALLAASQQWPVEGLPENPKAWLIHVAGQRLTDRVRSDLSRGRREAIVVSLVPPEVQLTLPSDEPATDSDDSLVLLFMCAHPSLTPASAIALTLRAVAGLTTAEIARAFLVPEATMAQRISRAKQTIKASAIPFQLPSPAEREARLRSVLHVLYLVFNEGYVSSSGPSLQRPALAREAIRVTRLLHARLPEHAEVTALLALMLLTDARRDARATADGELIPLPEQDRFKWDQRAIAEGLTLVAEALARGPVGPYQIQAAIAALHDEAPSAETTDWAQIAALYAGLERLDPSPMVTLNRAIAVAMVQGPSAGLAVCERLDRALAETHRLDAVRGHLHEMAGDLPAARAHYRRAAARTTSFPERNYLLARLAKIA
jgi:RNA polymerase sigma factor (sigma-70 family)